MEEVLVRIQLQNADNEKQVDNLTKSITDLKTKNDELIASNKALEKAGQTNTKQYLDNTKQLEINKQKIAENTASRKGLISAIIAEDDSIKSLRVRNSELLKQRDQLSTKTDEGRKKIALINSELDRNNKTIRENSSAQEKQKFNIGNYASALDNLVPGLGGVIQGTQGMTKASYAFIATGVGAIIAGVGLALAALVQYFKGSEAAGDKFAKVSAQISAVLGILLERTIKVGKAIFSFFSGDVLGGIENLKSAFTGLGDEIQREVKIAGDLADILDELEERELSYELRVSSLTNEIKKLIIEAKNRTLTEQQRAALLAEADKKEKERVEELLKLKEDQILATARQIQLEFSEFQTAQKRGETALDFAKRIVANEDILLDKRKELVDKIKEFDQAQGESLALQEKIQNQRDLLEDKAAEKREKRIQDEEKAAEERRELRIERLENEMEREREAYQRQQEFIDTFHLNVEANAIAGINRVAKVREDQRKKDEVAEKKAADKQKEIDRLKTEALIGSVDLLTKKKSAARIALTAIFKADAIRETTINTYNAAVAAYKSLASIPYVGPILGAAAAAAVTVFGLSNVARIVGINFEGFATGGKIKRRNGSRWADSSREPVSGRRVMPYDGSPINRSNGDNRIITAKVGEVVLNENQQASIGTDALHRAKVPGFATGGIVGGIATRTAIRQVNQQSDIRALAAQINSVRTILVMQDFEAAEAAKNEPIDRAIVI